MARSLRLVRAALIALGALLGWGAAAAVLGYTGREPVNVWDFLLVLVLAQLVLLLLLVGSFALPSGGGGVPLVGALRGLAAATYPRLAAGLLRLGARVGAPVDPGNERLEEWRQLWHRLRSRRSLYRQVEPWELLRLTQAFGVAFNLAALLSCLRLVVFSDLAFSWSTTLVELDAGRFHAFVNALATPWSWALPDAVPTRGLVEATRYARLEGAYVHPGTVAGAAGAVRAVRPELVGGWWPFLLTALACYGLFPRLLTLLGARVLQARALATLPLDDVEVTRLVARLTGPHVDTRAGGPEVAPPPWPTGAVVPGSSPAAGRLGLVLWRDVPDTPALVAAVARRTGGAVLSVRPAGGRDHEEGTTDWDEVARGVDGFVVVAEAFEAPDRGLLGLLERLRAALGPRRYLHVLLIEALAAEAASGGGDLRLWREGLARLEDPHLAVSALEEAA